MIHEIFIVITIVIAFVGLVVLFRCYSKYDSEIFPIDFSDTISDGEDYGSDDFKE